MPLAVPARLAIVGQLMRALNHSIATAGLDDPEQTWMQTIVRIPAHPEWGKARVLRWYPAEHEAPERLRIMAEHNARPVLVRVDDVERLTPKAM